ncbi:hypothetical protein DPMN_001930 [Dreissena polymorpha]|uniref:Uncharacterized protein n=1 Tax=Dreissena polymorpha TaxID=45954 RepID=A0A9D4MLV1_DREPO|nr:hypothetical protein DPMN_001930 [Dreissena polymorpha]
MAYLFCCFAFICSVSIVICGGFPLTTPEPSHGRKANSMCKCCFTNSVMPQEPNFSSPIILKRNNGERSNGPPDKPSMRVTPIDDTYFNNDCISCDDTVPGLDLNQVNNPKQKDVEDNVFRNKVTEISEELLVLRQLLNKLNDDMDKEIATVNTESRNTKKTVYESNATNVLGENINMYEKGRRQKHTNKVRTERVRKKNV